MKTKLLHLGEVFTNLRPFLFGLRLRAGSGQRAERPLGPDPFGQRRVKSWRLLARTQAQWRLC